MKNKLFPAITTVIFVFSCVYCFAKKLVYDFFQLNSENPIRFNKDFKLQNLETDKLEISDKFALPNSSSI